VGAVDRISVPERKVRELLDSRRTFFFLSTGRTGTRWLSGLLNRDPDALVVHEPVPVETLEHKRAFDDPQEARRYIRDFRLREIYLRTHRERVSRYGEVNGCLRRHAVALQEFLPQATLIHIVRDGRDLVRSLVARETYAGSHPVYHDFRPPPDDAVAARWDDLSLFERSCYGWNVENAYLRRHVPLRVRFEDMLSSYDLFNRGVLEPTGLRVSEADWADSAQRPENATAAHTLPEWSSWSEDETRTFWDLCGEEMRHYGYER
jgi:Sulfotransferase family